MKLHHGSSYLETFIVQYISIRVKLRLKEQEPWKTVFHSSYLLSSRDTKAKVTGSSIFQTSKIS